VTAAHPPARTNSAGSRRLLYLLLRRALLDATLPAEEAAAIQLAGLALHQELGAAPAPSAAEDGTAAPPFKLEQYMPKSLLEQQQQADLSAKLVNEWRRVSTFNASSRALSGRQFCMAAMALPHYGFHLFAMAGAASATEPAAPLLLGVSLRGLLVARAAGDSGSRRRQPVSPPLHRLAWQDAEKVSFKGAKLVVASTTSLRVNGRELGRLNFQLSGAKLGKYLAALCSQLHDWSGRMSASWPELSESATGGVQRWASQTLSSGGGGTGQGQQQRMVASGPARASSSVAVQPRLRHSRPQATSGAANAAVSTVRVRSMLSRLGDNSDTFVHGEDVDDDVNPVSAATDSSGLARLHMDSVGAGGGSAPTVSSGSASYSSDGGGAEAEAEDDDTASSARRRRQDRRSPQRRRRSRRLDRGAGASGSLSDIFDLTSPDDAGGAEDQEMAGAVGFAFTKPVPPLRPPPPQIATSASPTKLTPGAGGSGRRWASNPTLPTFTVTPAVAGPGDDDGGSSEGTASTQDTIIVKSRHQLELDRKASQLSRVSSGGVRDLLPGDRFKVTLRKKDDSFGFYVWGGTNTNLEGGAIYVKSIAKGGAADLDARLRINDKILWVNSVSLERVTHKVAMETLLSAPEISVFHLQRGQSSQPPEALPPPPDSPTTTEDGGDSLGGVGSGGVGVSVGSPDSSLLDSASVLAGRKRLEEAFPQLSSHCDCLPVTVYKTDGGSVSGGYHPGISTSGAGDSVSSDDGLAGVSTLRHFGRVKRVLEHSHESVQRLLREGDLLLEIADQPVYGRSHGDIVAMLRSAPSPMRLYIARPRVPLLLSPEPTEEASAAGAPTTDSLRLSTGGGLGFLVAGGQDTTGGCYIRSIVRDPALSDGVLRPGDRLLAVNDTDVSRMRHEDCVEALRAAPRRVRIRVLREFDPAPTDDEEILEEDETEAAAAVSGATGSEAGDSFSDDGSTGVGISIATRSPYLPQSAAAYSVLVPLPREADGSRPLPLQLGDLPSGGVCVLAVLPTADGEAPPALASVRIGDRLLRVGDCDLSAGASMEQVNEMLRQCDHLDEIDLTLTRGSLGLPGSGGDNRISEETEIESLTSRDDADTSIMESSGIFAPEELAEAGVIVDDGDATLPTAAASIAMAAAADRRASMASASASDRSTPVAGGDKQRQPLTAGHLLLSAAPLSELHQNDVDAAGLHRP
uniref:PH domain-containing protein n=1 Tax=Macrostomum lignano TaxID=282301 RepID=A0A1I8JBQ9_9PLAT